MLSPLGPEIPCKHAGSRNGTIVRRFLAFTASSRGFGHRTGTRMVVAAPLEAMGVSQGWRRTTVRQSAPLEDFRRRSKSGAMAFVAVLDANVLYLFSLRDLLLRLAEQDCFVHVWSERIKRLPEHAEVVGDENAEMATVMM
jgi:hypothetical protein